MKIGDFKTYLFNASQELSLISSVLQKNNSIIEEKNKILPISKYPFIDGLTLSGDIKDGVKKKFSNKARDTKSILLSLISVVDVSTNKRHHILSAELEGETVRSFFINYDFLARHCRLSRVFLANISKLNSINRVIVSLTDEIRAHVNNVSVNRNQVSEQSDLELAIEKLKNMIDCAYSPSYKIDHEYFLFSVDNIRFRFVSDYLKSTNRYLSGSRLAFNFYDSVYNRDPKKVRDQFSLVKYQPAKTFSDSQNHAFNTMDRAINLVIGAGGAGKTYMAKILAEMSLELNAILRAQGIDEGVPFLYTTFSKGSLEQFLRYCSNGVMRNKYSFTSLIYTRDKNVIVGRKASLSSSCDKSRYQRVEQYLNKIDVSSIITSILNRNTTNRATTDYLDYVFATNEIEFVQKYMNFLNESYEEPSFFTKLCCSLGLKDEKKVFVPDEIINGLTNTGRAFPQAIVNSNIPSVVSVVKNKYLKNSNIYEKKFAELDADDERMNGNTTYNGIEFGSEDTKVTLEDIIYYLEKFPSQQNISRQAEYKDLLDEIEKAIESNSPINFYKKVKLKNGKTGIQPDEYKARLFTELFPISADLVTNVTDLDIYFEKVVADEAVLIPGLFTPMLLEKANSIIAMGDINQLELELNLQGNLSDQVEAIHKNDPKVEVRDQMIPMAYPLTYGDGGQMSLFAHLKKMIDEDSALKILVDNYRCRKDIFDLTHIIEDKYKEYITRYKAINNISNDSFIKFFNSDDYVYTYGGVEKIASPFLFISDTPNKYRFVEQLLEENQVATESVFIIVPFKEHINTVKAMLTNKEIVVDTLENLQGRDAQIVIYDSFIDENIGDEYKELTFQKFNLTVTRARNLFIFIGSYKTCFNLNISDRSDDASRIINKVFREGGVDFAMLQADLALNKDSGVQTLLEDNKN